MRILRTTEYRDFTISVTKTEEQTEYIVSTRPLNEDEIVIDGTLGKNTINIESIQKNIDDMIFHLEGINPHKAKMLREKRDRELLQTESKILTDSDLGLGNSGTGTGILINIKRS